MKGIYHWVPVVFLFSCSLLYSCRKHPDNVSDVQTANLEKERGADSVSQDFLSTLRLTGVFDAAKRIGLDAEKYLIPLAAGTHHTYRRYRWSVGHHESGGIMISALPPEEEAGWTPWERWYKDDDGMVRREAWVMYPLRDPSPNGVARWYKLEADGLAPRYLKKPRGLREQLALARVDEAARVLGFDAEEVLVQPLSSRAMLYYQQCRWVVIPHILGGDGPVIYILPPANRFDEWPWESWYTDGKIKLIHHVHYTRENGKTIGSWQEFQGAPQRPPEIFDLVWYWYDDTALKPTMAEFK